MKQKQKTVERKITKDMTIGDVAQHFPAAIDVLIAEGIQCVGCGAAYMETIEEGLIGHGKSKKEIKDLLKRMNEQVAKSNETSEGSSETLTVTEKAASKIKEVMKNEKKENFGLRIKVIPGGCSGYQYNLDFDKKAGKNDTIIELNGIKMFLDSESFSMLKGSRVDYIESLQGAGFKIDNPNAQDTCGCGDSFN